ncbi:MAG: hypothetical protein ACKPKO_35075, partial [Candidatus Fonsibacter sp.]
LGVGKARMASWQLLDFDFDVANFRNWETPRTLAAHERLTKKTGIFTADFGQVRLPSQKRQPLLFWNDLDFGVFGRKRRLDVIYNDMNMI